ncbi:MAG TPA: phosphatidylserine decarboxylase, partial [Candidatus Kapabacteria bacterium]|nr:phosphatidylserine decarboxylase [Candidatus Kapabacteria bacterium]
MLTKYGRDVLISVAIIIIIVVVAASFINVDPVRWGLWLLSGLFLVFTLYFFRDPERTVPPEAANGANVVISPGDGKVVQIIEAEEREFFGGKVTQVSVFLSPLNVHVNRIPLT